MTNLNLKIVFTSIENYTTFISADKRTVLKGCYTYNRYIQAHNTSSHAIRNARRRFESSLAYKCWSNNKTVWNYANSQKKSGGKNLQLQKENGSFTKDDASKAEVLNQHYYAIFSKENMQALPLFNYYHATTNFTAF